MNRSSLFNFKKLFSRHYLFTSFDLTILLMLIYFVSDKYSFEIHILENNVTYGGKYRYLTILGMYAVIFVMALDFLNTNFLKNRKVKFFCNHLCPVIASVQCVIFSMFWFLYFFYMKKLFGEDIEYVHKNHTPKYELPRHALPLIFLLLKNLPFDVEVGIRHFAASLATALIYTYWAYFTFTKNKKWPYPLMDDIESLETIFLIGGLLGIYGFLMTCGLNYFFCRIKMNIKNFSQKKKTKISYLG